MSIKKAFAILGLLAVILIGSAYYLANKEDDSIYTTSLIKRGSIIQTVSETGTVKASNEMDLSFLNQGKLFKKHFMIGDKVKEGDVLAELDHSSLEIQKEEAQANYDVARQNLNKLIAGATDSEIAVKQAMVDQARIAFDAANNEYAKVVDTVNENIAQAEKTLSDLESDTDSDITAYEQAVNSAETTLINTKLTYQASIDNYIETALVTIDAKNAVANTALDVIDRIINDEDAEDLISVKVPKYLTNTKEAYKGAKNLGETAENIFALAELNPTEDNVKLAIDESLDFLNKTFEALQNCFSALENTVTSSNFSVTDLDTFKTNVSTQKTNVSTAISSVQTVKQNLNDAILAYSNNVNTATDSLVSAQAAYNDAVKAARNALSTAKFSGNQKITAAESLVNKAKEAWNLAAAQLDNLLSPANKYDIALAEAKVRQAKASLERVNKQIEDSIIISPIDGTVTKLNYEIGEQVPAGQTMISVLGDNNFEIEVLVSEADISKTTVGDQAEITLDSFGDDVKFYGEVTFIEPAETEIQDVIYYKVTVNFDPGEKSVKSGMTANVIITTAQKDDVLLAPSRAVIENEQDEKIIRILEDNKVEYRNVVIGLRGDDGLVEVLTGVNAGEEVITYVKKEKD
jgi:HlyD family secretion protein